MLGALGPIHRARVSELWSDDPERACSPAQRAAEAAERIVFNPIVLDFFDDSYQAQYVCFDSFFQVQQRGPLSCSQILTAIMDGVEPPAGSIVWVVDLMPNRLSQSYMLCCEFSFFFPNFLNDLNVSPLTCCHGGPSNGEGQRGCFRQSGLQGMQPTQTPLGSSCHTGIQKGRKKSAEKLTTGWLEMSCRSCPQPLYWEETVAKHWVLRFDFSCKAIIKPRSTGIRAKRLGQQAGRLKGSMLQCRTCRFWISMVRLWSCWAVSSVGFKILLFLFARGPASWWLVDLRLPQTVEEALGGKAEILQKVIKAFNDKHRTDLALPSGTGSQTQTPASRTPTVPSRTMCQPVFVPPDAPLDFLRTFTPSVKMVQSEFEGKELLGLRTYDKYYDKFVYGWCYCIGIALEHLMWLRWSFCDLSVFRLLCKCIATSNANLKVAVTKQGCEVWLLNDTEEPLDVSHGELFGFNVGTFTDRAVGRVQVVK